MHPAPGTTKPGTKEPTGDVEISLTGGSSPCPDGTGKGGEAGILRLDFDPKDESLKELSWDSFFEKFDRENLSFLYQDETEDGRESRFHKFIDA